MCGGSPGMPGKRGSRLALAGCNYGCGGVMLGEGDLRAVEEGGGEEAGRKVQGGSWGVGWCWPAVGAAVGCVEGPLRRRGRGGGPWCCPQAKASRGSWLVLAD